MAARFRPTLAALWTFLAIALPTLAALLAPMPAVDLAYQLRAGGEILDSGAIPSVDWWTFTVAGSPWTDQQWGAQVLLELAYRATGWSGLAILRAGLVALAFGLLLLVVRRRNPGLASRWQALLVLAAFLVAAPALALRPQLFAILLFAATLLILADRRAYPRRLWLIPLIAVAWTNLHGSFPLVLVLVGLAVLEDMRARPGVGLRVAGTTLVVAVVSGVATLVNPFGLDVWGYVYRLSTNPTIGSRVSEWRPPGLTDLPGILFWASVVVVAIGVAATWRRRRAIPLPALLTLVAFAALGAITGRGLAWWPLAAVFVLADVLPTGAPSRPMALEHRPSLANGLVMGLLVVAGIALLPFWRPTGPSGVPLGTLSYAPEGIAAKLRDLTTLPPANPPNRVTIPVWAPQHWASWLELEAPSAAMAVDSRIEVFPQRVWDDYDRVQSGADALHEVPDRYGVQYIVTERGADAGLRSLLNPDIWMQVYADEDGAIWERIARG